MHISRQKFITSRSIKKTGALIVKLAKYCSDFQLLYCSETTLTGESRFHISPPRGFEPVSLVAGSKQVVHWTSETWRESCEIAGSAQYA